LELKHPAPVPAGGAGLLPGVDELALAPLPALLCLRPLAHPPAHISHTVKIPAQPPHCKKNRDSGILFDQTFLGLGLGKLFFGQGEFGKGHSGWGREYC